MIVAGHGSELTVESQPGHGACFRFRLRAVGDEMTAASAEG
jgi:signal transduction histidine kinase